MVTAVVDDGGGAGKQGSNRSAAETAGLASSRDQSEALTTPEVIAELTAILHSSDCSATMQQRHCDRYYYGNYHRQPHFPLAVQGSIEAAADDDDDDVDVDHSANEKSIASLHAGPNSSMRPGLIVRGRITNIDENCNATISFQIEQDTSSRTNQGLIYKENSMNVSLHQQVYAVITEVATDVSREEANIFLSIQDVDQHTGQLVVHPPNLFHFRSHRHRPGGDQYCSFQVLKGDANKRRRMFRDMIQRNYDGVRLIEAGTPDEKKDSSWDGEDDDNFNPFLSPSLWNPFFHLSNYDRISDELDLSSTSSSSSSYSLPAEKRRFQKSRLSGNPER